jgi:hypothetical protein
MLPQAILGATNHRSNSEVMPVLLGLFAFQLVQYPDLRNMVVSSWVPRIGASGGIAGP